MNLKDLARKQNYEALRDILSSPEYKRARAIARQNERKRKKLRKLLIKWLGAKNLASTTAKAFLLVSNISKKTSEK